MKLAPWPWPWRRRRILALKQHSFASELVRLSTEEHNISDIAAFAKNLRALLGPSRATPVALSLPNQCAHIALLNFDVLPENPAECASLVRWRLEKDLQIPVVDCRIAYRIFVLPAEDTLSDFSKYRMLVAAIQTNVLTQYEQVCELAELVPVDVGIQALQLFDLSQAMIDQDDEWFFVSFLEDYFFFVAMRHGCPFLMRSKPLPSAPAQRQRELLASIQYYDELRASMGAKPQASQRSLFILGSDYTLSAEHITPTNEGSPPLALEVALTDSHRINVRSITKDFFPISWPASDIHWTSGLSAMAALSTP
ncbi:MAG: hypothetical protein ABIR36_06315 [Nitrospiraceae bacterium]